LLARAVVIPFAVALDDLDEMIDGCFACSVSRRRVPLDNGKICGGWPVA